VSATGSAMPSGFLAEHDDYLLKDIGLSQDEAFREAVKPFWRR
jgi:uncharacterized protein YjiS (DUF1127 family)